MLFDNLGSKNMREQEQKEAWSNSVWIDQEKVEMSFSYLQGRILSIIEAIIPSDTQLEGVKNLIKREFGDEMGDTLSGNYTTESLITRLVKYCPELIEKCEKK